MSVRRCLLATAAVGALAVSPGAGSAQEIGSTAPNVSGNSPEHPLDRAAIGPITFDVGGEAQKTVVPFAHQNGSCLGQRIGRSDRFI